MKKAIISILSTLTLSVSGCNYLDINPEMGLDEDQVFTVWDNFKSYYYNIYTTPTGIHCAYPLYLDMNARRYTWYQFTDLSDAGRLLRCQQIKSGTMGENAAEFTTSTAGRAISYSMFRIIRVCNKCIENIGRVQNVKQENKDDLLGQAYFVRAYAHFTLCRIFGGMPYLDKALDENDEWDMARLTAWETYSRCAEDFDRAYECFVSAGKVRRDAAVIFALNQKMTLLQTDASVNPGNSGGGLFDGNGKLVGIVNAKSSGSGIEGLGFAIPINTARDVIEEIMKNGYVTGRVEAGISVTQIDEQSAYLYRLEKPGVYISAVTRGSAAEQAGLQAGDRIVEIDGKEIKATDEVVEIVQGHKVGEQIAFKIERDGKNTTVKVTLGEEKPSTPSLF